MEECIFSNSQSFIGMNVLLTKQENLYDVGNNIDILIAKLHKSTNRKRSL